ncbi:MAG: MBL fold metallo-hydrolase, partial [Planctomycetaceae bacterium]
MLPRRELFPHVIEINHQARRWLGCSVYLVYDEGDWLLIDIGFEDTVEEIIELIRQVDFPLSNCRYLVATHADVDHVQGLKKAKELLPNAEIVGHPSAVAPLAEADRILTYAEISAQDISIDLPRIQLDATINEGDALSVGGL